MKSRTGQSIFKYLYNQDIRINLPSTVTLLKDSSISSIFPIQHTVEKAKNYYFNRVYFCSALHCQSAPEIDSRSRNRHIFCQALPPRFPSNYPRAPRNGHAASLRPKAPGYEAGDLSHENVASKRV